MCSLRHRPIFGPDVMSAATSVGLGRISKSPTLLPVERCQRAIVALLVAVRSAVITNGTRGSLAFAICLTGQDTLTARGGYLVASNVLLYVQGGAAWTNT